MYLIKFVYLYTKLYISLNLQTINYGEYFDSDDNLYLSFDNAIGQVLEYDEKIQSIAFFRRTNEGHHQYIVRFKPGVLYLHHNLHLEFSAGISSWHENLDLLI
jgi:hypothetical protein